MSQSKIRIEMLNRADSVISGDYETCCDDQITDEINSKRDEDAETQISRMMEGEKFETKTEDDGDTTDGRIKRKRAAHTCGGENNNSHNWAEHRNVAEGLMDIALLSANANQLRFLITYNNQASTYYISLCLIALSLILQVAVGIALIFKRRMKSSRIKRTRTRINEFLVGGVFMVTVINVLLAAFTTTDGHNP